MKRSSRLCSSFYAIFILFIALLPSIINIASNAADDRLIHLSDKSNSAEFKMVNSPEFKFSALMPEGLKEKDMVSAYGSSHSWIAKTKDGYVYEIAVTKYSSFAQKTTKSLSEQESKLQETIKGFFTNLETRSGCEVVSKNLNRKYKIKGSPAAEYKFSAKRSHGRTLIGGQAVFLANKNMDYIFVAFGPEEKFGFTKRFFSSIKIK